MKTEVERIEAGCLAHSVTLWRVEDGGGVWWYFAKDGEDAKRLHLLYAYVAGCGEETRESIESGDVESSAVEPNTEVAVDPSWILSAREETADQSYRTRTIRLTARDWCALFDMWHTAGAYIEPMLATTEY